MKIDLQLAGSPAEIRSQIADASKAARRDDPQHAGTVFGAISDVIGRKLAGAGPDAQLVARVLIDISDATGVTEQLRDFVEGRAKNETQRAQAAAIANERPAPAVTSPVVTSETDASAATTARRRSDAAVVADSTTK